jgi:L,D-peptidoglycan transpeptidase YkuD (ErfK/YbiS/YcfS/YnhG family)
MITLRRFGPVVAGLAAGTLGLSGCANTVVNSASSTQSAVTQLITVRAASPTATTATLVAYRVVGGKRIRVFGPWTARVGYKGVAAAGRKREGDGKTPSGTFNFGFFFGIKPNPGVKFSYRRVRSYDYWDDDSTSSRYNQWVDARRYNAGRNPEPMNDPPFYDYGAVIGYNQARKPGAGSAIFLHVAGRGATAGCVSLPVGELLKVLRWLNPAYAPKIQISAA